MKLDLVLTICTVVFGCEITFGLCSGRSWPSSLHTAHKDITAMVMRTITAARLTNMKNGLNEPNENIKHITAIAENIAEAIPNAVCCDFASHPQQFFPLLPHCS